MFRNDVIFFSSSVRSRSVSSSYRSYIISLLFLAHENTWKHLFGHFASLFVALLPAISVVSCSQIELVVVLLRRLVSREEYRPNWIGIGWCWSNNAGPRNIGAEREDRRRSFIESFVSCLVSLHSLAFLLFCHVFYPLGKQINNNNSVAVSVRTESMSQLTTICGAAENQMIR